VILDELARLGVRVIFSDAPAIDDDPQARLLTQVQGVIAEYEAYPDIGITLVMPTAPLCRRNARWGWFDLVTAVQGLRKSA
jgi:hypothetical protein